MAKRNIVKDGDPILRKTARPVEKFDQKLWDLLDDMEETMIDADGVGIAGPQVGILRRVCIVNVRDDDGTIELINPKIIESDGEQEGTEGCLSFPGKWGTVKRAMNVTVEAQNRNGVWFRVKGTELKARAMQHEIDHLNGVCFVDIASKIGDEAEDLEDIAEDQK